MDNLIVCTRCGSDACYVDEVNIDIKTQFCYGCGFQTNSLMKEGQEFYEEQISILPELYKDLIYKEYEENGLHGAYDWAYEYNETHDLKIPFHWCEPCDNHTPSIDNECCCCGSDSL